MICLRIPCIHISQCVCPGSVHGTTHCMHHNIPPCGPRSRVLSMCHRGSCCPCCLKGALDLTQYHAVGEVWSCIAVDCHEAPCPLISAGACSDYVLGGPWPLCSQQPFVLLVLAMISLPRVCSGLLLYHCDWWSLSVTNKGLSVTFWSWKTAKTHQFWCRNLPLPVAPSNSEKQNGGLVTWRRVKGKVPSLPGSQSTQVTPWSGWSLGTNDVFEPFLEIREG